MEIQLTQGKKAIIDDVDYNLIKDYRWAAVNQSNCWYAVGRKKGSRRQVKMHRLILGITDPNILVDHEDNNGLNNLRSNIRITDYSGNNSNKNSAKNSTSKYLGVSLSKRNIKGKTYEYWVACITVDKKTITLGSFKDEWLAAECYNKAAIKYHGKFAKQNVK